MTKEDNRNKTVMNKTDLYIKLNFRFKVNTDWTSVIFQSLHCQIALNTGIHRHIPLYDFSNIGPFYKSHWYNITKPRGSSYFFQN